MMNKKSLLLPVDRLFILAGVLHGVIVQAEAFWDMNLTKYFF